MNTKRILALVLALLMVFSLTACGGPEEEEVEYQYDYEYVSGEQTGNNQTGNNQTGNNQTGNKQTTENDLPMKGVNLADLKGKTVRYATWKDPKENEDGIVVDSFQEKYGIKVKIDYIQEGEYVKKISGLISSGKDIPDVFFCNETFPACLKCLDPISKTKIDLDNAIWDKTFSDYFTINGDTYLVNTVGNIWNETDMLFYNKKVLIEAGYSDPDATIQALIDQGKWTFETLTTMMQAIKNYDSSYIPAFLQPAPIICSTGANWFKFSDGKFTQSFDSTLYDATKQLAQWKMAGLVSTNMNDMSHYFTYDKMGFAVTNAWGLKATGYYGGIMGKKMDPNNIGFTYIPDMSASHKAVATGKARGYGLVRGASEPEAAGAFLCYYLDVNNYDCSTTFISKKAETFFFNVTDRARLANQNFYNMDGLGIEGVAGSAFAFAESAPANVEKEMKAAIPQFNNVVNQLNQNIIADLAGANR